MFQDRSCCARDNDMYANFYGDNMNVDMDMTQVNDSFNTNQMNYMNDGNFQQEPIVGPVQERQVHRTIMHEVPHVCPIHTRVINHHIFRHTFTPRYTCSEENTCSSINCGSCQQFR